MKKYIISGVFLTIFAVIYILFDGKYTDWRMVAVTFFELILLGGAINVFLPKKKLTVKDAGERKLKKSTVLAILVCLLLMPATVLFGVYFLGDRKYYFISLLLILEIIFPFLALFEGKKPDSRVLVLVSVLCAISVMGRCAFYMLPQFKPTLAIVIISGVVFGGETGFLVGAISAFVSNMFFGQGPWTPWQMLATGIVGFFAGVLFNSLKLKKSRLALCIYGGLATVLLYGGILNPASVIMYQPEVTLEAIVTFCISGLPFDLIHAQSTVFFLWIVSVPMIEKLERVKTKYGLV